jgi:hypothetical protein
MNTETVEVILSKTDIEGIAKTVKNVGLETLENEYKIAKLCKERARRLVLDKIGKVPKLGSPEISRSYDGGLVLDYPITGFYA